MKKFVFFIIIAVMCCTTYSYSMQYENSFTQNDVIYYQVIPKKVLPKVVKVTAPPVQAKRIKVIIPAAVPPCEVKVIKVLRPTPWIYNYPQLTYPYYQGNYDYRYSYNRCDNIFVRILQIPKNILDVVFSPIY